MSQHYSDPKRESNPYALPDCEVFYASDNELESYTAGEYLPAGWYWWACFPGCLPDSDPCGPFETEAEALADAQDFDGLCDDSEEG
jgi:hypothetical protein